MMSVVFSNKAAISAVAFALLSLALPLSRSPAAAAAAGGASAYVPQTVPEGVVALTRETFAAALTDAVNPLFLLEFYAPWCGHCKALAPVLEQVAPQLRGRMAIGTVDCTQQKQLCDEQQVRGYPTLKFSLDGEIHDYPMGRSAADILAFAEKFNHPQVHVVTSQSEAQDFLRKSAEEGVAFVAYHPGVASDEAEAGKGSGGDSSLKDQLERTALTQIYHKVARKMMAFSHFMLYQGSDPVGDFGQSGPFLCRLELNVPIRCFDDWNELSLDKVLAFCKEHNVPTVARLAGHNFQKIGRNGKPVVIGVVDASIAAQVDAAKEQLQNFALEGPLEVRNKYYYGWIDGKLFQKFLKQFDIEPEALPQVFVLNVPQKKYWQNATFKLNVNDFVMAVEDGTLEHKRAGKKGLEGVVERFMIAMMAYHPWSVGALVLVIALLAVVILSVLSPAQDLQPPYKQNNSKPVAATPQSAEIRETKGEVDGSEPKKDK